MDLQLEGKVAIVTGASRGLGRAIAGQLADEGCDLAICARGEEELERAARELGALGRRVTALTLDLAEEGAAARLVERAVSELGRLDVVVSNVGGNRRGRFTDLTEADWDAVLDLNLRSHTRLAQAAIPHLERPAGDPSQREMGVLLFTASLFGREAGGVGLAAYNSTKSALISLAKIMALELAERGIRVLSVAPGSIRFPGGSWDRRCREEPEKMAEFVRQNLPLGRFGTAEELADAVAFLVSPRASLITGACIAVDGSQGRSLI